MLKNRQEVGFRGSVFHHIGQEMVNFIHVSTQKRLRNKTLQHHRATTLIVLTGNVNILRNLIFRCIQLLYTFKFFFLSFIFFMTFFSTSPHLRFSDSYQCTKANRDVIPLIKSLLWALKQCKQQP